MNKDHRAQEVIKRWDLFAEQYAAFCEKYGDINKEVLVTPLILEMLENVEGQNLLDAGCGEGYLSRLMAERGAIVTAVDYSEGLLDIARERTPDKLGINYLRENLENLSSINDSTFTIIVSCLVLQDVPDHQKAVQEMYRVLQPGGVFILVISHPCFSSDGGWIKDSDGKKEFWKIDNYFFEREIEIPLDPGSNNNPIGFHRTLTNYFRTITKVGFIIEELIEPFPSQDAINKHPSFKDDLRMSHFLLFKLRKQQLAHR